MGERRDVIVVGVGGMGSAAAYHLARRGLDVLGLERFDVPHSMGSSHGNSRIIRMAYFEHPSYVPLLRRSYELWRDLQAGSDRDLLHVTGCVTAGPPGGDIFEGARRSCETHDLPHDVLTSEELTERFPAFELPEGHMAVHEPEGGFLVPEQCVVAHVEGAQRRGAEVRARERVTDWEPTPDGGVRVGTDKGEYEADALVVSAGPWTSEFVPELAGDAVPERQVVGWFQPDDSEAFAPDRFPVFVTETEGVEHYGFPVFDVPGFKLGRYHHLREDVDPDDYEREPTAEDEAVLREYAERYFPAGAGPTMRLETCLFTNSPDERFIIDTHPDHPQVAVAAGFSGHGFKFSALVGEVLADLVTDGETAHDIGPFRMSRL